MPKFVKYRGAGKVPITSAKVFPEDKGKSNPRMHVMPRRDWINPGEKVPITRRKNSIYSQSAPIPRRASKK